MDNWNMTPEQIHLIADGPGSNPANKEIFRQVMSAFRFAYTAWECAAIGKPLIETGSFAWYSIRNVDEASRLCGCNKFVMTDKMQAISDWLQSKGMRGICGPLRQQDGSVTVVDRTAGQMMDQMKEYMDAGMRMISLQQSITMNAD